MADSTIDRVDVSVYRIPTDAPEADGTISWESTTMVVVELRAAGQLGLGFTYSGVPAGQMVSDVLAPLLVGRDPIDIPAASEAMNREVRNLGRPGTAACAISACDIALWDLKARLLDLRLTRLLGRFQSEVPIYGSGGFTTYSDEQLRDQFGHWVHEQRIPRVKMKVAESWGARVDRDLRRIALARDIIGPDTALFIDANGGYNAKQAIRVADAIQDANVTWFEEPVSSDDLAGLRRVRHRVTADVAAGEYGWDLSTFALLLHHGAVDCLQADITRCGGVTAWLQVAALAAAHHVELSGHCAPHLHLDAAAATPNLRHLEWFHDHVRIEDMLFDGTASPRPGGLISPDLDRVGHGLSLRTAAADDYRIA